MRHHLLSAVLLAIGLGVASPALAEDAECGILCRINGYLSSDHMTADPGEAAPTAAPKNHRAHVARRAKPPASAAPKLAATPAKPAAEAAKPPVRALAEAAKPTPKPAIVKAPSVASARTAPVSAKTAPAVASHPAARPAAVAKEPVVHPAAEAVAQTSPAPVKPTVRHRLASAARPAQTADAQTASAMIPGAAPAMPMGFQPFAVSYH